jgi:hypothetical protein
VSACGRGDEFSAVAVVGMRESNDRCTASKQGKRLNQLIAIGPVHTGDIMPIRSNAKPFWIQFLDSAKGMPWTHQKRPSWLTTTCQLVNTRSTPAEYVLFDVNRRI